jgi:hypothetical protein
MLIGTDWRSIAAERVAKSMKTKILTKNRNKLTDDKSETLLPVGLNLSFVTTTNAVLTGIMISIYIKDVCCSTSVRMTEDDCASGMCTSYTWQLVHMTSVTSPLLL